MFSDKQWSNDLKEYTGIPRPYFIVDDKYRDKKFFSFKTDLKFFLHKKIPIPWQSAPSFIEKPLSLIIENEQRVYLENLCAYCGIQFYPDEDSVMFITRDVIPDINISKTQRVFSDYHPFHIECMKQGRIFCPFMRSLKDKDFKYGKYVDLKNEFIKFINSII
jgi:hypothetical protein